ncbi:hypothetical protein ZWY2020_044444 [Hordeum vulgare]|nr:hypothetical protein ZWY2020_044444 [Hordeum vulgare]
MPPPPASVGRGSSRADNCRSWAHRLSPRSPSTSPPCVSVALAPPDGSANPRPHAHHIDFPEPQGASMWWTTGAMRSGCRHEGCVYVVGCVRSEELVCWEDVPQSVRLEGLTDFCWLCENPQKLVVPFEMRGYQGVYNLERRVYEGEARGLSPVQGPLPVKFPPDPETLSLKPGSLNFDSSKSALVKTESVSAAIAGARAVATQYSRKGSSAARISSYASLCSW